MYMYIVCYNTLDSYYVELPVIFFPLLKVVSLNIKVWSVLNKHYLNNSVSGVA